MVVIFDKPDSRFIIDVIDTPLSPIFLPVTFTSKKSKKGVYYNPYFPINNPDTEGRITSFNDYIDPI